LVGSTSGRRLERDAHLIGDWLEALQQTGPTGLGVRAKRWSPPALDAVQQATLKAAVQAAPSEVGVDLAKWTWKGVRQFVEERFECLLSSRTCLNYLHRLGFVVKRSKK
jgi:transposase